jgi:hypothetical protein
MDKTFDESDTVKFEIQQDRIVEAKVECRTKMV